MIQQPDTSTMEGRHQVELASRKFRIQELLKNVMGEWGDYRDMFKCPTFWWIPYDYRIHPDDLAAWSETQVRDVWTMFDECSSFARGKTDRFQLRSSTIPNCEILAALNGAPAAVTAKLEAEITELKKRLFDSMSETERTKEDRNRLNFKFERELKRQLADKDAETEAASGRRHENP
jgi:hypothetical protein